MGWILLGLLLVFGLPVALLVMGMALAIWVTLAVAGAVWGLVTFLFGAPVLGVVLALVLGIAIGRAMAHRPVP
ncbi:hypothetical protein [Siccirubricoccus sp. G192]|uniref:hypothetical protein n=1 Tax=Siccirubricoccus sp. G192 TaxID=2849651 RepID=UPI001C2BB4C3|nr:hypothetical protein [Siccirubricoccus sp. G192]MBV1797081.1 hypothetical protein [Siccirubricoccus sp. G192]